MAWAAPSPAPPLTPATSSPPPPASRRSSTTSSPNTASAIHAIGLDVTDAAAARTAIAEARGHFGRLDVIVNNAGYANVSPIETTDDEDFRAQFETNFWGVYHVSKAAIPVLREQGSGLVIQISSVGGRVGGSPGIASYQAAKFAIDGFSRVLRAETAPFGVKVMVVEPSGFRTDWAGSSMTVHDIPEAYAPTVGAMNSRVRQSADGPAGDPARAAEILVQVAKRAISPTTCPSGSTRSKARSVSTSNSSPRTADGAMWAAPPTSVSRIPPSSQPMNQRSSLAPCLWEASRRPTTDRLLDQPTVRERLLRSSRQTRNPP